MVLIYRKSNKKMYQKNVIKAKLMRIIANKKTIYKI